MQTVSETHGIHSCKAEPEIWMKCSDCGMCCECMAVCVDDLAMAVKDPQAIVDVSMNKLEGELSSGFGSLDLLQDLRLHDNTFTGTIPAEFSQLSSLRKFSFIVSLVSRLGRLANNHNISFTLPIALSQRKQK